MSIPIEKRCLWLWTALWLGGCYSLEEVGGDGDGDGDSDSDGDGLGPTYHDEDGDGWIDPPDVDGDGAADGIGPDPTRACPPEGYPDDVPLFGCLDWTPREPGDFDGDGVPDETDVDDDNDLVLDEAPDPDLVAAVRPLAQADCAGMAACCSTGWPPAALEACERVMTSHFVLKVAQSWADGYFSVRGEELESCLQARVALTCDSIPWALEDGGSGCSAYMTGRQPAGRFCWQSTDCEEGLRCTAAQFEAEDRFSASCVPWVHQGESCDNDFAFCAEGLSCDLDAGVPACLRIAQQGESCGEGPCDWHLYCDEGSSTCRPQAAGGEACVQDDQCLAGCDRRREECLPVTSSAPDLCYWRDVYRG